MYPNLVSIKPAAAHAFRCLNKGKHLAKPRHIKYESLEFDTFPSYFNNLIRWCSEEASNSTFFDL